MKNYRNVLIVLIVLFIYLFSGIIILFLNNLNWGIVFYKHIFIIFIAICLGIFLSNITEDLLFYPVEMLMNFIMGFGFKKQDAEYGSDGVPIVSLRKLKNKFYNPVAVAMAAFKYYEKWINTNDKKYLQKFINCTNWLVSNLKLKTFNKLTYGIWEYEYPWSYNLTPPWISGLAQGVGIQVFSKAYNLTKEKKYYRMAIYALNTFLIEVKNGGVTYKDNEDEWWYEEYVGKNAKESRVLNGMIYAVIGIYEFYKNTGNEIAKCLFIKGIQSLKKNLKKYDAGWWTFYDNLGLIADKSYHTVHLDLIKKLYEVSGEKIFLEMYYKWSNYKKGFFVRRFIKGKPSWHDRALLVLNIGGMFLFLELITFLLFLK